MAGSVNGPRSDARFADWRDFVARNGKLEAHKSSPEFFWHILCPPSREPTIGALEWWQPSWMDL